MTSIMDLLMQDFIGGAAGSSENGPIETKLEDLPDELLARVLYWLPTETLPDVALVSHRWKLIVYEDVGLEVCISDNETQRKFGVPSSTMDPEILGQIAVQACNVRMITGPVPLLLKPEKLKFLMFRAPVSSHVFGNLVQDAVNLTQLQFFYSSLSADDLSGISIDLPNLKLLHVCDRSLESSDMANPEYIIPNISTLLGFTYPFLTELKVSVVADRRHSEALALSLFKFLQNHYRSLKRVRFNVANALNHVMMINPNISEMFESVAFTKIQTEWLDWSKLSMVQLDILELDFGKNFVVGPHILTRFLGYQSALKELVLFKDAGISQDVITKPVTQSFHDLVYLQIGIDTRTEDENRPAVIDCSVFETCQNLRKLGLFGISRGRDRRDTTKELVNVDKLPDRILALLFKNVNVGTDELESIVYGMRHIVKLTCDNIGSKNGLGVNMELLKKIIQEKKCREIIVKGFNPEDADPAAHAEFARIHELHAESSFPHCQFHAKYNDELGQYISICM